MAKAQFHKNQKVWVETVGTWAVIERIVPVWAKGFEEPVRITYDVGLGRDFTAAELQTEGPDDEAGAGALGDWRLLRARNKWQQPDDCGHHPFPGTFPVVVTDQADWGGWRVPGAEYDRDPRRIEFQARLIAAAPRLMALADQLIEAVAESPEDAPPEMRRLAERAQDLLLRVLEETPPPPAARRPVEPSTEVLAPAPEAAPRPAPSWDVLREAERPEPAPPSPAPTAAEATPFEPRRGPAPAPSTPEDDVSELDRLRARLKRLTA